MISLKQFMRMMFSREKYYLGIIYNFKNTDIFSKMPPEIQWVTSPSKKGFYADPFITSYFGEPYLFFEEMIESDSKGIISCVKISDVKEHPNNVAKYVHPVLTLDTHLSFPYLFTYGDDLYMVPENAQSGTITLWKNTGVPTQWEKIKELQSNFAGVDTILFHHNGCWWLFSTKHDSLDTNSGRSNLYIWHSNSPLGEWTLHPQSPILHEKPTARAAGAPFIHNGSLYRPVQDCTKRYGGATIIMKIMDLNETTFLETDVMRIDPIPPHTDGLHTFSFEGNLTIIDGIKDKIDILKVPRALLHNSSNVVHYIKRLFQ